MVHNPASEPTDAEIADFITSHNLPICDRTYEGIVGYAEQQLGLAVEPSEYSYSANWADEQIRITDADGNESIGRSDNIRRSFLIAFGHYLRKDFGIHG